MCAERYIFTVLQKLLEQEDNDPIERDLWH